MEVSIVYISICVMPTKFHFSLLPAPATWAFPGYHLVWRKSEEIWLKGCTAPKCITRQCLWPLSSTWGYLYVPYSVNKMILSSQKEGLNLAKCAKFIFSSSLNMESLSSSNNILSGMPLSFMICFLVSGHSASTMPALALEWGESNIMVITVAPALRRHNPKPNQQTQSSEKRSSSHGDIL